MKDVKCTVLFASLLITQLFGQSREDSIKAHFHYNEALRFIQSDLDSTNEHLSIALEYFTQIQDYENIVNCYNGRYYCQFRKEEIGKLKGIALKALELAETHLSENNPAKFNTYNNLGTYYYRMSDFPRAISYYKQAQKIYESGAEVWPQDVVALQNNFGTSYSFMGDWFQAELKYNSALALIDSLEAFREYEDLVTRHNLAKLYKLRGLHKKAKNIFNEIILLPENLNTQEYGIESLMALIEYAIQDERIQDAQLMLEELQKRQENFDNYKIEKRFRFLSEIASLQGDDDKALSYSYKYVERSKQRYAYSNLDYRLGEAYQFHGINLAKTGNEQSVKENFINGLQAISTKKLGVNLIQDLEAKAIISPLVAIGILKSIMEHSVISNSVSGNEEYFEHHRVLFSKLTELLNKAVGEESDVESKLINTKDLRPFIEYFISYLTAQYDETKDQRFLELAFRMSLKNKGRILIEELQNSKDYASDDIGLRLLNKRAGLRKELAYFIAASKNGAGEKYKKYILQIKEEIIKTQEELVGHFPKQVAINSLSDVQIDEYLAYLRKAEIHFLDMFYGKETLFVFSLFDGILRCNKVPLTPLRRTEIAQMKEGLQRSGIFDAPDYCNLSYTVYANVFEPIWSTDPTNERIVFYPDGEFIGIPIESLSHSPCLEEQASFLELDYLLFHAEISYINVVDVPHEHVHKEPEIAAYAPKYDQRHQEYRFPALNFAGAEISGIQQYFQTTSFEGDKADLQSFREHASNYSIIHIVAHSHIDNEQHHQSKLFFSNIGAAESEEFTLFPFHLYGLKLRADMVVLSACETGVGKYFEGEGVFSFARHFVAAGAKSVVNSLWKVDDNTTSKVVKNFYRNLSTGVSKSQALSESKGEYLRNADAVTAHPYYWSGIVLLGDVSVIQPNSLVTRPLIFLGIILLLILGYIYYYIKTKGSFSTRPFQKRQ